MNLTVVANPGAQHQASHARWLAEGVERHGVQATIVSPGEAVGTRHVACWGWRHGARYRAAGHEVLVMERGYFGDRFHWTSIGWNGLNGFATFPQVVEAGRFARHHGHLLKPWNPAGDYVLLMGQVPGDMSLRGRSLAKWYGETAQQAAQAYGLPVMFRQHPESGRRGYLERVSNALPLGGALGAALEGAAVVVTFNSNAGCDALLAGKPTVAVDEGSMAWGVAARAFTSITEPDRAAWANRVAWCQWSPEEIRSGVAWEHVRTCIQ